MAATKKKPAEKPAKPAKPDLRPQIAELWRRLEAYVASIGAPALALAAEGASEKAIAAAEKAMGVELPDDYRASLLLHDGQDGKQPFPWMPGCAPLASVDDIVEMHARMLKKVPKREPTVAPESKLKGGMARAARIPIGERVFLDLDPGPAGTRGQLVAAVSDTDLVAIDTSFAAALERWVSALERGIWVYSAAANAVHPKLLEPGRGHGAGLFSRR